MDTLDHRKSAQAGTSNTLDYIGYTGLYRIHWTISDTLDYIGYTRLYRIHWTISDTLDHRKSAQVDTLNILDYWKSARVDISKHIGIHWTNELLEVNTNRHTGYIDKYQKTALRTRYTNSNNNSYKRHISFLFGYQGTAVIANRTYGR